MDSGQLRKPPSTPVQNPEFYKKQAMRLSTWKTPRIICCAENLDQHVALPRGCTGNLEVLARRHGMALTLDDRRVDGEPLDFSFKGELTTLQSQALATRPSSKTSSARWSRAEAPLC